MYLQNRGNGSWRLTISDGYNPDGSKRRLCRTIKVDPNKTERAQRRDAEKQAAIIESAFLKKQINPGAMVTMKELAEDYLDDCAERGLKQRTIKQYRDVIDGRVVPALGKIYVQDLTSNDIKKYLTKLKTEKALTGRSKTGKLSGTTRRQSYTQIHAMLTYAVRSGIVTVNVADQVTPPLKDTKVTAWFEPAEVARLLEVLDGLNDPQWKCFFMLSLYTAMRPGELIGLNWSDIKEDHLRVNAGSVHVKGKGTQRTESPKTKESARVLVIPAPALEALNNHRRTQIEYRLKFGKHWPEPDAVFTTDDGRRMNLNSPTHKFRKILEKSGLPHITLYGLRHTAASTLIAAGMSPRDVAAQLGHAQTSTTMDIYAHAFADANRRAADAISDAYENAKTQVRNSKN